jgi:hypothetical protein
MNPRNIESPALDLCNNRSRSILEKEAAGVPGLDHPELVPKCRNGPSASR